MNFLNLNLGKRVKVTKSRVSELAVEKKVPTQWDLWWWLESVGHLKCLHLFAMIGETWHPDIMVRMVLIVVDLD